MGKALAAWIMMAIGLTLALLLHLLPIMLAGMLMVQLVHVFAPHFVIGTGPSGWTYANRTFILPAGFPNLELRGAAWFSRATPYVLAEVASLSDRGEYQITVAQTELLEQAGVMIAELAEPLSQLFSSVVHGNCGLTQAGFVKDRAVLRNWNSVCIGLPWLDIAVLSADVERISNEALVALISSYAEAADYAVGVVGDLIPFCRALHDVLTLDRWNTELSSGVRKSKSLMLESYLVIRRLLELSGA